MVIDSVAALTPKAEIEGEMGDHHMGLQARLMSQALRKLTGNIQKSNTMVIFINQIRMKIGVMFGNPETTTGGNALKFYSSVRLDIRRTGAIKKGDEILITELEHHSNYVPWNFLRTEKGAVIKFAQVNESGDVEIEEIKKLITNKTKMIAITHISNVTGAVLPITKIVDLAKEKNIPVLIDGTQGAPHSKIDMQKIGCDFYAISCHKMYGPNGLGILYMKKTWVDDLPPYQGGGGMINEVKKEDITFADAYTKFEAGTMQTAEVVAFTESLNFIEDLGIKNIASHENEILQYGLEKLRKNNSVNIIGDPKERGSVLCFTLKDIHPHDIATILDDDGVAIRAGHHCCQILHDKLGIPATARASIGVYNDKEDIDKLSEAIKKCQKVFQN